jgi:tetrahydromethanopterin S-methyltransferase subunit G
MSTADEHKEIKAVQQRLDKVERRVKVLEQTVQVYKREV